MTHITGKENTNFRLEAVAAKADIDPLSSICESESEPTASVLQSCASNRLTGSGGSPNATRISIPRCDRFTCELIE